MGKILPCINKECKANNYKYLYNCEINGFPVFDENKIGDVKCLEYKNELMESKQ
jgi:hypothetical protein